MIIAIDHTRVVMTTSLVPEVAIVTSAKLTFLVENIESTAMGICIEATTGIKT